jgi:hypothetical protein
MTAAPSAFQADGSGNLYNDTYPDLLDNTGSGYAYLFNNSGLITTYDYYDGTTTATSTSPGNVYGMLENTYVQQGQDGTPILTGKTQYYQQTYTPSGSGAVSSTTDPIASQTVYRNTDGTGGETTSYSYTYYDDGDGNPTNEPESVTTTLPTVTTGENGSGTAQVSTGPRPLRQHDLVQGRRRFYRLFRIRPGDRRVGQADYRR